ncbi:YPR1 (YDR368W) and GCY1 (YOR120W) [Zygosaccharomyces parabailii]|nr:YPR1 (YDR368W) and GCY1 (YOR120W) [Zygosaccharomyces parabailii]
MTLKTTMANLENCSSTLKLNTGASIPQVGLGTWRSLENEGYVSVAEALKDGYRHIDGAAIYGNESQVGMAIKDSGIPREKIFLTTKLWSTQHRDPSQALEDSLERLGVDYVDLYLMHWPLALKTDTIKDGNLLTIPEKPDGKGRDVDLSWNFVKTWELMQKLLDTGKVKAIGVSNFSINNLKELLAASTTKVTPAVNQVELHPLLPQTELVQWCKQNGIVIEAYSPLGGQTAPILSNPVVQKIAQAHGVDSANVVISWGVQKGLVVLPKSVTPKRIKSNLKVLQLNASDISAIDGLAKVNGEKRTCAPDWSPFPIFQ